MIRTQLTTIMSSKKPVCLIIGAGPGIGYSVARKWTQQGYQVVIVRRSELSQDVLDQECCPGVIAMRGDVTDKKRMKEIVNEVETKYGSIQTLIYNAGSWIMKNYESLKVEELEHLMKISCSGLLVAAQTICPRYISTYIIN